MEWLCRRRRAEEHPRAVAERPAPRTRSAEDYIPYAAALDIGPRILRVLTKPSTVRTIPVRLRLFGYHQVYVQSHESARGSERNDRAYDFIRRYV